MESQKSEVNPVDEIIDKLFLGDVSVAMDTELMHRIGVTHILTVEMIPLPEAVSSNHPNVAIKQVAITDMPESDLLTALPAGIDFIKEGIESPKAGGTLVHCYAGVSRSAAFVVAYLMKANNWTLERAVAAVKAKRPTARPNSGFMKQLELFEAMGCSLNPLYPPFRAFKLNLMLVQLKHTQVVPYSAPQPFNGSIHHHSLQTGVPETVYRCRKCRSVLASSNVAFPHASGPKNSPQSWYDLLQSPVAKVECRQGIFIEPQAWMGPKLMTSTKEVERLNCMKCNSRVGTFSWEIPVSCSCGIIFEPPSFHINASRVDKCTMHKDVEASI